MFAPMFLAMYLTTPPPRYESPPPRWEKDLHFLLLYNLYISLYVVSVRIQNASHFFFFPYVLGNITKNESKLFLYNNKIDTIEK